MKDNVGLSDISDNKCNHGGVVSDFSGFDPSDDFIAGLKAYHVWSSLASYDIRQRYRRSVIGPFWFTLSTMMLVGVLGFLYSGLFKQELAVYVPYLAVGLVVWQFIATVANESCTVFIGAGYLIKQVRMPLTVHVCHLVWRNVLIFLHSLPVVILLLIYLDFEFKLSWLLVPVGLLLLTLNAVWVGLLLGVVCTRYRDIPPIVGNLVTVTFFLTPVFWMPEILSERAWVANYNPLFHLIEIIRAPLLGREIDYLSWVWVIGFLIVGSVASLAILKKYRARVPYWL